MTWAAGTRRCLAVALSAILSGSCASGRAGGGTVGGPPAAPGADEWRRDTLLDQEGFWALTLTFEPDYDGPVSATLIRRPLHRERECAVLYLHGYVDYFFQAHLADFYQYTLAGGQSGKGCDFFALDLRKYGRSLPPQYRYPNFAKNLDEYYPEITKALTIIRGEGYPFVLLNGHSTGALTAARYLQDGTARGVVDAAFLNSPFLDFNDRDISRFGATIARLFGTMAPHNKRKSPVPRWYALSLLQPSAACMDCHGRWIFDTDLKKVKKILKQIGAEIAADPELGPELLEPLKSQGVMSIDDSALIVRAKYMSRPGSGTYMIRRLAYEKIIAAFAEQGIQFASRRVAIDVPRGTDDQTRRRAAAAAIAHDTAET